MKKFILATVCMGITLVCLLGACNSESYDPISDYMPVREDTVYSYEGTDNYTTYTLFTHYTSGNAYQRRTVLPTHVYIEVLSHEKGELRLKYSDVQTFGFNYNSYLEAAPNSDILILKEPLKLGSEWVQIRDSSGDSIAKITALDKEITVPHGTYKAMEVTVTKPNGDLSRQYYAKGIGLIKSDSIKIERRTDENDNILSSEQFEVTSELAKITEGTPLEAQVLTFYPASSDSLEYISETIPLHTNSDANGVFMATVRGSLNSQGVTLSEATIINKYNIDSQSSEIIIDFTPSFVEDMKNSNYGEAAFFRAMVNTVAFFNNCMRVKITVDGSEYKPDGVYFDENGFTEMITPEQEEGAE